MHGYDSLPNCSHVFESTIPNLGDINVQQERELAYFQKKADISKSTNKHVQEKEECNHILHSSNYFYRNLVTTI